MFKFSTNSSLRKNLNIDVFNPESPCFRKKANMGDLQKYEAFETSNLVHISAISYGEIERCAL